MQSRCMLVVQDVAVWYRCQRRDSCSREKVSIHGSTHPCIDCMRHHMFVTLEPIAATRPRPSGPGWWCASRAGFPWKRRFNIGRRLPLQSLRPSARPEFAQADNRRMTSQSPPTSIRSHGTGRTTHESTPFSRSSSARRSRHAPSWPLRRRVSVSRPRFALMRFGARRTRACSRHRPRLQVPHRLARAPPRPLLHNLLR
jgi:hypothetical protein